MKRILLTFLLTLGATSASLAQDESDPGADGAAQVVLPGTARGVQTAITRPIDGRGDAPSQQVIHTAIPKPVGPVRVPAQPLLSSDIIRPIGAGKPTEETGFSPEQQAGLEQAVRFYRGIVDQLLLRPEEILSVQQTLSGIQGIDTLREFLGYRGEREGAINDAQLGQLNQSFRSMLDSVLRSRTPQTMLERAQQVLSRPDAPKILGEHVIPPSEIRHAITRPIDSAGDTAYRAYDGPVDHDSFQPFVAQDGTPIFRQDGSFYELQGRRFIPTDKRP